MLSKTTVAEVNRLIAEGELTQRQIAAKLNISRATISNIERGITTGKAGERLDKNYDMRMRTRKHKRCPGCGAKAQLGESGKCLECDCELDARIKRLTRQKK